MDGEKGAYVAIAIIYEIGGGGIEKDYIEAKKWYTKSINETGDVKAYMGLGRLYYTGRGVTRDYNKAYYYFSAIESNNKPGALYMLGILNEYGHGTEKNISKALEYYRRAADNGHALALRDWALLTIRKGNIFKGIYWLIRSLIKIFKIAYHNKNDPRLRIAQI